MLWEVALCFEFAVMLPMVEFLGGVCDRCKLPKDDKEARVAYRRNAGLRLALRLSPRFRDERQPTALDRKSVV